MSYTTKCRNCKEDSNEVFCSDSCKSEWFMDYETPLQEGSAL